MSDDVKLNLDKCVVCGNEKFEKKDGFFFCVDCGTQSQLLQDFEYDNMPSNPNAKIKIKTEAVKAVSLTSWEEHNIILARIVEEIMQVSPGDDLKLVVFQLYAHYLKINEAAFFSKKHRSLPKLSVTYRSTDAGILYNRKRARRRSTSRSSKSSATSQRRSENQQPINQSHNSIKNKAARNYMRSECSSTNESLNSSTSGGESDGSIRIKYSSKARKILKKTMHKRHIDKHEKKWDMPCHSTYEYKKAHTIYFCDGIKLIYLIVYLALNYTKNPLQFGDLQRFIREKSLPFRDFRHYFPSHINPGFINQVGQESMSSLFNGSSYTALKLMGFNDFVTPDLIELCRRYLKELNLPSEIASVIERLIKIRPPTMKQRMEFIIPNYEARAMAYIIFVLKLLLGLNDKTELLLSKSAESVNAEVKSKSFLFVWTSWRDFIEMRKTIIKQCHYPTAVRYDPMSKLTNRLQIQFMAELNEKNQYLEEEFNDNSNIKEVGRHVIKSKSRITAVKSLQTLLSEINEQRKQPPASFIFKPSLTPQHDYLERIKIVQPPEIFLPDLIHDDHQISKIEYFIKRKLLQRELRRRYEINLEYLPINAETEYMEVNSKFFYYLNQRDNKNKLYDRKKLVHSKKVYYEEDNPSVKDEKNFLEDELYYFGDYQVYPFQYQDLIQNYFTSSDEEENVEQPEQLGSDLNVSSCDEHSDDDVVTGIKSIPFFQSEHPYWIKQGDIKFYKSNAVPVHSWTMYINHHFDLVEKDMPTNFVWLLNLCADTIEQRSSDLYLELMTIENVFFPSVKVKDLVMKKFLENLTQFY